MNRIRKKLIVLGIVVVTFSICLYLSLAIFIGIKAENNTLKRSDAILVLGARSYINGKYNPCLQARVVHAVDLYKGHYGSKILMTGGNDKEDNVNEAETMKKIAVERGVNPGDILLEKRASSTYENFVFSREILMKNGLKSVIIVTEPFHIARAGLVAEKLELNYHVSPTVNSPCWSPNHYLTKYFLKEPFAIIMYKIENKL